MALMRSIYL